MNHGIKPDFEYERDYSEWWDFFVKSYVKIMKHFWEVILNHCVKESKYQFSTKYNGLFRTKPILYRPLRRSRAPTQSNLRRNF